MALRGRAPGPDQDPAVAPVEALLGAAAARHAGVPQADEPGQVARLALWICACVTTDDSPTWLVTETHAGVIAWRRVPDGVGLGGLVQAELVAGGHADPAEVLRWLHGEVDAPWAAGGHGFGDDPVLTELASKIRPA